MSFLKKSSALAVGLGILGGLMAVSAPADASYQQCDSSGRLCAWNDISYQGQFNTKYGGQGLENISHANNDKFSSDRNNTGWNSAMYENAGGKGKCLTVWAHTADPWLGDTWGGGTTWNDKISSWKTNSRC